MLTESRCDGLCLIASLGQTAGYRTGHHRLRQRPIVKPLLTARYAVMRYDGSEGGT